MGADAARHESLGFPYNSYFLIYFLVEIVFFSHINQSIVLLHETSNETTLERLVAVPVSDVGSKSDRPTIKSDVAQ